jgi:hypothetical protein
VPLAVEANKNFGVFNSGTQTLRNCKFATGVNDTSGKFAAGINNNGTEFVTCVNDTAVANNGNNIMLLRP